MTFPGVGPIRKNVRVLVRPYKCCHNAAHVGERRNHTGFLLEATSFLRPITALSSVDLPTLARPVGGLACLSGRRIGRCFCTANLLQQPFQ